MKKIKNLLLILGLVLSILVASGERPILNVDPMPIPFSIEK